MKASATCTVKNKLGFHVRPTTMFTKAALGYSCGVRVSCNGQEANGKSTLELMCIGAYAGDVIKILCDGPDAKEALQALTELVESSFDGID